MCVLIEAMLMANHWRHGHTTWYMYMNSRLCLILALIRGILASILEDMARIWLRFFMISLMNNHWETHYVPPLLIIKGKLPLTLLNSYAQLMILFMFYFVTTFKSTCTKIELIYTFKYWFCLCKLLSTFEFTSLLQPWSS